ncbi:MAG: hypothetical protein AVDCRST_MAG68-4023, partial [uncultured Gemmatimonadetes bacterium]
DQESDTQLHAGRDGRPGRPAGGPGVRERPRAAHGPGGRDVACGGAGRTPGAGPGRCRAALPRRDGEGGGRLLQLAQADLRRGDHHRAHLGAGEAAHRPVPRQGHRDHPQLRRGRRDRAAQRERVSRLRVAGGLRRRERAEHHQRGRQRLPADRGVVRRPVRQHVRDVRGADLPDAGRDPQLL